MIDIGPQCIADYPRATPTRDVVGQAFDPIVDSELEHTLDGSVNVQKVMSAAGEQLMLCRGLTGSFDPELPSAESMNRTSSSRLLGC